MSHSSNQYHGTHSSVPPDIQNAISMGKRVEYWSRPNPNQLTCFNMFCLQAAPLIMLPCFWPHLLILSPFFCMTSYSQRQTALATEVAITDSTVEIFVHEHDACCIPYCYRQGQSIESIPLMNITDVATDARARGCLACSTYSHLRIDHIGKQIPIHGHENLQELKSVILDHRNARMGHVNANVTGTTSLGAAGHSNQSTGEKLIELVKLKDMGLITEAEYEAKRSQLVAKL